MKRITRILKFRETLEKIGWFNVTDKDKFKLNFRIKLGTEHLHLNLLLEVKPL